MFGMRTKGGFFKAAKKGDVETLKEYIADSKDWLKASNSDGWTALHYAVKHGQATTVTVLLEAGIDPNLRTKMWTSMPLAIAVWENYVDIVKILLAAKASPNESLCLGKAIHKNHAGIAHMLLDAGANPNLGAFWGATTLHEAVRHNDFSLAQALLDKGALIEACDSSGRTALHCAAEKDHFRIVQLLLDRGANPDTKDVSGKTPLETALEKKSEKSVEILSHAQPKKSAAPTEPPSETWSLQNSATLAHVTPLPGVGRLLTEVFNFAACERRMIVEKNGVDSIGPTENFDTLTEPALQAAWDKFKSLGGVADENLVFRGHLRKGLRATPL